MVTPRSAVTAFTSTFGRYRRPLIAVAALFFFGGMAWSVSQLDLRFTQIAWASILAALALSSVSLVINAVELQLCARAVGKNMQLHDALAHSSAATVANILPLPGSLLVRGAALKATGADWNQVGRVMLAAGVMWLAMSMAISGYALIDGNVGLSISVFCVLITLGVVVWLWRQCGWLVTAGFVGVRLVLLALLIVRLSLLFTALASTLSLADVSAFALAGIVGSAVGLVPAGIGVTEAVGAAMAIAIGQNPASAFLVLAINRIMGLTLSGLAALVLYRSTSGRLKVASA